MIIKLSLVVSVLLQFSAAVLAIGLIRRTRYNISWILISCGFLLMAIRRLYELILVYNNSGLDKYSNVSSWIAVLISLLMFIGTIYIRRIFNLQARIDKLRRENESRVLSAIIRTEEKERQKFAKELHDGLGPILSSIKLSASAIDKSEMIKPNRQVFEKVELAVDQAILGVKEISNNLSPHVLERFGLEKAVRSFVQTLSLDRNFEIAKSFKLNPKRYDYDIEVLLYRTICELITNTLKHANATKVEISLFDEIKHIDLIYSDNGIGFDIENNENMGMGLANIRSRIKSLNGSIEIYSEAGEGLLVKIVIPL